MLSYKGLPSYINTNGQNKIPPHLDSIHDYTESKDKWIQTKDEKDTKGYSYLSLNECHHLSSLLPNTKVPPHFYSTMIIVEERINEYKQKIKKSTYSMLFKMCRNMAIMKIPKDIHTYLQKNAIIHQLQ